MPAIGKSPGRARLGVGVLTMAISGWMSNTATTAMMLPVALGVVRQSPGRDGRRRRSPRRWRAALPHRAALEHRLRRVDRRPAHAGRKPSQPHHHRPARDRDRGAHRFPALDAVRGAALSAARRGDVRLGAVAFSEPGGERTRRTRRGAVPRSSRGPAVSATARSRSAWPRCCGCCPEWWRWRRPIHRRASCSRRASTKPWSPSSRPRSSSCCRPTGAGAPSRSSGVRRPGSTGARYCSSAAASRSAD